MFFCVTLSALDGANHLHHLDHDDHLNHLHHLDHDELMIIKFESKLEVVHKEVVGCTQESWRLSDQMRIATLIALNS